MVAASNELQPPVVLWDKRLIGAVLIGVILAAIEVWALFANVSGVLFALGAASTLVLLLLPIVIAYRTIRFTLQTIKSTTIVQPIRAYARAALRRSTFLILVAAVLAVPLFVIAILYTDLRISAIFANLVTCSQLCPPSPESRAMTDAVLALITGIGLWGLNPLVCALGTSFAIQSRHTVRALLMTLVIPIILAVVAAYALLFSQVILSVIAALLPYVLAVVVKSLWKSAEKPLQ